eukprot:TRINITY_DN9778_c0_g1_i1.p1 TRINITY_DN9778_c0_g1~~TRINITY_DN9778_c0_g1_i1.p1  ORF type:complete len:102 (+),score=16.82 TRINITY_DN9778_c0_g1_i1:324-629(+)
MEDYIHPMSQHTQSGRSMEFDVFVPSLNLAFEYQGYQHYNDHYMFGPLKLYKTKDEEKKQFCTANGITLIKVPHWWDYSLDSLISEIKNQGKESLCYYQLK